MADESPAGDAPPWSQDPVSLEGLAQQGYVRESQEAARLRLEPPPVRESEPERLADVDPRLRAVREADFVQRVQVLEDVDNADSVMAEVQSAVTAASRASEGLAPVVTPSDTQASGEA